MELKEELAISELRRLARRWPKTLWLMSAEGALTVMRFGEDGRVAITATGAIDPAYAVETIEGIPNDGGRW
jgi:hypothetical protein